MQFFDTEDLKDYEIFLSLKGTFDADTKRKWVPYYSFDIHLLNGGKIGFCNLRIDNSILTYYCGNIGFGIDEEYRGRHYSLKAVKLLLKQAEKHNLKYVLITAEPDNQASNKICRLSGAEFIETAAVPKDHEMYLQGKQFLNIYKTAL